MKACAPILAVLVSSCSTSPNPAGDRPALVILLDAAGSMAGATFDRMKGACLHAAAELIAHAEVGLLAFSDRPTWELEIGPPGRAPSAAWSALKPQGPSDLGMALEEALRRFRGRATGHVIVISDGSTSDANLEASVRHLVDGGVTVSAVCVGESPAFDAALLSRVAEWGRGRFLFTHRPDHLRKLLVQDARAYLGPR